MATALYRLVTYYYSLATSCMAYLWLSRFSEMYIFGKFDTFKRRLEKIIELLNVFEMFSSLSEAMIEGIEPHAARYERVIDDVIVTA